MTNGWHERNNEPMRWLLYVILCSLLCSAPRTARADAAADYQDAIEKAVLEFEAGSWAEARVLFRRAHELNPSARTWRGLGITAFELRRYVDAIAELEAALADPRKPLTQQQRAQAQELLARARAFVSVYRVAVTPEDAEVLVDGKPAQFRDGALYLDPGQHSVIVRAPGYREEREDLRVEAGEKEELSIALSVVASAEESATATEPAPPPQPVVPPPPPEPAPRKRVWTWVLGGTGLAAAGAGIGLGVATKNKNDAYARCTEACGSERDAGMKLQTLTNVMFATSGVLVAGAVIAFFLEGRQPRETPRATLLLDPHGVGVVGRF